MDAVESASSLGCVLIFGKLCLGVAHACPEELFALLVPLLCIFCGLHMLFANSR